MAYPKYSILITVESDGTTAVTQYTTKVEAKAAMATAQGLGKDVYLYLEAQPSISRVAHKWAGYWIDAYGDARVVGTGELD